MARRETREIDVKPWSRSVTKVLAFAEDRGARIVGVTGDRTGVGVSLLSRELARAYKRYGIDALLVDASRIDFRQVGRAEGHNAPIDLLAAAQKTDEDISVIDLAEYANYLRADPHAIREMFEAASGEERAIVVDLPPAEAESEHGTQVLSLMGAACTLVYLVCLSGVTSKAKLGDCMEVCRISRLPVGGMIINDWKEPIAKFATGW